MNQPLFFLNIYIKIIKYYQITTSKYFNKINYKKSFLLKEITQISYSNIYYITYYNNIN